MAENFLCALWLVLKHELITGLCLGEPILLGFSIKCPRKLLELKHHFKKVITGVHQ